MTRRLEDAKDGDLSRSLKPDCFRRRLVGLELELRMNIRSRRTREDDCMCFGVAFFLDRLTLGYYYTSFDVTVAGAADDILLCWRFTMCFTRGSGLSRCEDDYLIIAPLSLAIGVPSFSSSGIDMRNLSYSCIRAPLSMTASVAEVSC